MINIIYKILDNLATHGIGEPVYPLKKYVDSEIGKIEGFTIIDVRMLNDLQGNSEYDYKVNIARHYILIVVCLS